MSNKKETVTIDGISYNWSELSNEAKKLILSLQAVDGEIARLKNLLTFCEVAKASYSASLKRELNK